MTLIDKTYCNLPWKDGGRSRAGLDCAGLAQIWLNEQMGLHFDAPPSGTDPDAEQILGVQIPPLPETLQRGDCVFFRSEKSGKVCHVAIHLGDNRYLHILRGLTSRIEVGTRLIERLGLKIAGAIPATDAERLCLALRDPKVGTFATILLLVLSLALSAASAFLLRPKLGQYRNQTGVYGFDQLATQTSSELPLPDMLGAVTVAGNSPFQSMIDQSQPVTDETQQKANKVVILCSGPVAAVDSQGTTTTLNGITLDNPYFYEPNPDRGFYINPASNEADAVTGTIGSDTNRSSVTLLTGAWATTVPVDIRAQYDRDFPIYGFSGCAYFIFRLIDSTKFTQGFNLNTTPQGRYCRIVTSTGFNVQTSTFLGVPGIPDGVTTRFKLLYADIISVSSVMVNSTTYTPISPTNQTGNVYSLNATKGYIEFLTAPANGTTITVSYTFYPRVWSSNPAVLLAYMLTEPVRGKGIDPSKLNWQSFNNLQMYSDASITWINDSGVNVGPRWSCNYVLDSRKAIQDHIQAILDSCYGYLFISGGQFYVKARSPDSPVMDFDQSNIIAGSFSYEKIDRTQTANRIHVFFRSTETYNVETEAIRDNATDQRARSQFQGDDGVVEQILHVPAINNQPQAERYGEQILRENVAMRWTCQFTTNIIGLPVQPGDIVTVTHPAKPSWQQKLFRVEQFDYDANDQMTLTCSEYFVGCYI